MTDEEQRQMGALRGRCERQAADITEQRLIAEYRNQQLRALHIVWCTGCTCASSEEITGEDVAAVEAYAVRLRRWWGNKVFKAAWKARRSGSATPEQLALIAEVEARWAGRQGPCPANEGG